MCHCLITRDNGQLTFFTGVCMAKIHAVRVRILFLAYFVVWEMIQENCCTGML